MGKKSPEDLLRALDSLRKSRRIIKKNLDLVQSYLVEFAKQSPAKHNRLLDTLRAMTRLCEIASQSTAESKSVASSPSSTAADPKTIAAPLRWAPVAWGCTRSTDHRFMALPIDSELHTSKILSVARFAVHRLDADSARKDSRWVYKRDNAFILLGVACSPRVITTLPKHCWNQETGNRPIGAAFIGLMAPCSPQICPAIPSIQELNSKLESLFSLAISHLQRGWSAPSSPPVREAFRPVSILDSTQQSEGQSNRTIRLESGDPITHSASDSDSAWHSLTLGNRDIALCANVPRQNLKLIHCPFTDVILAD
jgi:hypothetical protein